MHFIKRFLNLLLSWFYTKDYQSWHRCFFQQTMVVKGTLVDFVKGTLEPISGINVIFLNSDFLDVLFFQRIRRFILQDQTTFNSY